MEHIIITGAVGVGKSTLIQRLLSTLSLPIYGFITKRLSSGEDGFHPIYIHPAAQAQENRTWAQENCIGTCNGKIHNINTEVFNLVGAPLLRAAKPDGVIVMDELGFMEAKAEEFTKAVFAALDGEIPVLAAVKNRQDVPFLQQVRTHPKAQVYTVTEQNRDELSTLLSEAVLKWKTC